MAAYSPEFDDDDAENDNSIDDEAENISDADVQDIALNADILESPDELVEETATLPPLPHRPNMCEQFIATIQALAAPTSTTTPPSSPPRMPSTSQRRLRPKQHFCPITRNVMRDPVVAEDGCSYERHAIEHWLQTHDTSPSHNTILRQKVILPNRALKHFIADWQAGTCMQIAPDDDCGADSGIEGSPLRGVLRMTSFAALGRGDDDDGAGSVCF